MVNANLGSQYDLAKRLSNLERAMRALSTSPLMDNASIGPGGLLNVEGTITATDPVTGSSTVLGLLPDGTTGLAQFVGDTTPPPVPSKPVVMSGGDIAQVGWDGSWANPADTRPPDFHRIVVRVAGADAGSILAPGNAPVSGLTVGGVYTFTLLAEDTNGNRSAESVPSDPVTIVSSALPDGWDTALQDQITTNAGDIATNAANVATVTTTANDAAANAVLANNTITNTVMPAISDAAASPVTDSRLTASSLTVWPFAPSTVPAGSLAPGSIGSNDIADFTIAVTKLSDTRHHLY